VRVGTQKTAISRLENHAEALCANVSETPTP